MGNEWTYQDVDQALSRVLKLRSQEQVERIVDILNGVEDEPPSLDEIALSAYQGILASGHYDDFEGAARNAWVSAMPAFIRAKSFFVDNAETFLAAPIVRPSPEPGASEI